jgi:hypothetical protein
MATIEERLARLERAVFGAPPAPPPVVTPPPPVTGSRDDAIIRQVHTLRGEGGRGNVLAAMFIEYAGAGSRLEPSLSKSIPNYRHWLDWRTNGGSNAYPIPVPSEEWTRMRAMLRALPV